tara:strand:- start:634 stop:921 length:288 start_codon:yes stop_codon:yes gene_type:complete
MECTVKEYIQSKSSILEKIKAIESLIDAMILNTAEAIDNSGVASYSMDTGQTKVTTTYRSVEEVNKGIKALEQTLQMYINRYNGRVVVLRGRLNG